MTVHAPARRDRVSTPFAFFAVLPAVAPLAVIVGLVPLVRGRAADGAGLPLAFAMVGAALLLFAVGYLTMSRHIPNAGNVYAYAAHGLGRPAGLGAAWLSLASYGLLQVSLYGLAGVAAQQVSARLFGSDIPWWAAALGAWLLVGLAGLATQRARRWILVAVGVLELAAVATVVATLALAPTGALAGSPVTATAFSATGAVLLPAVFAFAGFESATRFAAAGASTRRAVVLVTALTLGLGTALFAFAAWAVSTQPSIVDPMTVFGALEARLPAAAVGAVAAALLVAVLAALTTWQAATLRVTRSLGLERVVPGTLPWPASRPRAVALVAAPGIVVIGIVAALGGDPLSSLLLGAGMVGAYGMLLLLLLTAVAVVGFFAQDPRDEPVGRRLVAPAVAALLLGGAVVLCAVHVGDLIGVGGFGWLIAIGMPLVPVAGTVWALLLRPRRPHRYESIGLGPNAITGQAEADHITPPPYVGAHTALPAG